MKTHVKSVARMFKKHLARFLSLLFIVLVAVGFISGFGMAADQMKVSLCNYYKAQNVSDLILKSRSADGFSDKEIETISLLFPKATVETGVSFDLPVSENRSVRLQFIDFDVLSVNLPTLTEGEAPTEETQVWAEQSDNYIKEPSIGDTLTIDFADIFSRLAEQNDTVLDEQTSSLLELLPVRKVTVCGIVRSPLHFTLEGDPSYNNSEDSPLPDTASGTEGLDVLEAIYYLPLSLMPTYSDAIPSIPEAFDEPFIQTNDIYIAIENRDLFDAFSKKYKQQINSWEATIAEAIPNCEVLTLQENYSFRAIASYSDKLANIGYIIMAVFLLVTGLVAFSTMTRLLDEERAQIACLTTLGYMPFQILFKYLLFALTATAAGGFGAHFLSIGISAFVYTVFGASFYMPPMAAYVTPAFYFIVLSAIVLGTLLVTIGTGLKMTCSTPAKLLRPKSPKAGKKVFLEKFPKLWKKIPFKYKSTLRNVFRYVSRFLMSVISIAFSNGLVLTGLALLDLCLFHMTGTAAIVGISVVIIVFAGLLTAVVIYTLTNISISERNREIATLMVLGYSDKEVTGYIFREIYLNSIIGAFLGYPVGALLSWLLYSTIGSGVVGDISWFMWISAPVVILLFTYLVALLLKRKIMSVDMNDSLKSVE